MGLSEAHEIKLSRLKSVLRKIYEYCPYMKCGEYWITYHILGDKVVFVVNMPRDVRPKLEDFERFTKAYHIILEEEKKSTS